MRLVGMHNHAIRCVIVMACAVLLCGAGVSRAEPADHGEAVDQAVGDTDRLATSLRRVESGLRSDGEQSSLFRVEPSRLLPQTFMRVAPGLRARVERIDYLIRTGRKSFEMNVAPRRDGQFLELVPANTVFDLRPVTPATAPIQQATADATSAVDGRVDSRVNGAVDGRISNRVEAVRIEPEE